MDFTNLCPVQMFCPNCGKKIIGYKSKDGAVRIDCPTCRVKIFSKKKNEKRIDMELTIPIENY